MKHLRVHLARLLEHLAALTSYGPCLVCGRRHDPREHYPLHDDR